MRIGHLASGSLPASDVVYNPVVYGPSEITHEQQNCPHEWDLDGTEHQFISYRTVRELEAGVFAIDTNSYYMWESELYEYVIQCQTCGLIANHTEVIWE